MRERQSSVPLIEGGKELLKHPEGEWLLADGMAVESRVAGVHTLEGRLVSGGPNNRRLRCVGKYDVNNSNIAFVDSTGRMYIGRSSGQMVDNVEAAGYTQGTIPVPMSNYEVPTDPELAKKWEAMKARADREIGEENEVHADEVFGVAAKN
ncbi:MAG: hypothetical protein Q8P20_05205 [bacterium]|nr:hypothetical protein [bacterium]